MVLVHGTVNVPARVEKKAPDERVEATTPETTNLNVSEDLVRDFYA